MCTKQIFICKENVKTTCYVNYSQFCPTCHIKSSKKNWSLEQNVEKFKGEPTLLVYFSKVNKVQTAGFFCVLQLACCVFWYGSGQHYNGSWGLEVTRQQTSFLVFSCFYAYRMEKAFPHSLLGKGRIGYVFFPPNNWVQFNRFGGPAEGGAHRGHNSCKSYY